MEHHLDVTAQSFSQLLGSGIAHKLGFSATRARRSTLPGYAAGLRVRASMASPAASVAPPAAVAVPSATAPSAAAPTATVPSAAAPSTAAPSALPMDTSVSHSGFEDDVHLDDMEVRRFMLSPVAQAILCAMTAQLLEAPYLEFGRPASVPTTERFNIVFPSTFGSDRRKPVTPEFQAFCEAVYWPLINALLFGRAGWRQRGLRPRRLEERPKGGDVRRLGARACRAAEHIVKPEFVA